MKQYRKLDPEIVKKLSHEYKTQYSIRGFAIALNTSVAVIRAMLYQGAISTHTLYRLRLLGFDFLSDYIALCNEDYANTELPVEEDDEDGDCELQNYTIGAWYEID